MKSENIPIDLKTKSLIKNKLRIYLNDKDILDVILFGSIVKGKIMPEDIDVALITDKEIKADINGFHITTLRLQEFFLSPPSIVHTLLREGYSLKNDIFFSENYKFLSRVLFVYELKNLNPSVKVKIVTLLRGKGKENGLVRENGGEWLANQVFIMPLKADNLLERFLINFKINYKKYFLLMH